MFESGLLMQSPTLGHACTRVQSLLLMLTKFQLRHCYLKPKLIFFKDELLKIVFKERNCVTIFQYIVIFLTYSISFKLNKTLNTCSFRRQENK